MSSDITIILNLRMDVILTAIEILKKMKAITKKDKKLVNIIITIVSSLFIHLHLYIKFILKHTNIV